MINEMTNPTNINNSDNIPRIKSTNIVSKGGEIRGFEDYVLLPTSRVESYKEKSTFHLDGHSGKITTKQFHGIVHKSMTENNHYAYNGNIYKKIKGSTGSYIFLCSVQKYISDIYTVSVIDKDILMSVRDITELVPVFGDNSFRRDNTKECPSVILDPNIIEFGDCFFSISECKFYKDIPANYGTDLYVPEITSYNYSSLLMSINRRTSLWLREFAGYSNNVPRSCHDINCEKRCVNSGPPIFFSNNMVSTRLMVDNYTDWSRLPNNPELDLQGYKIIERCAIERFIIPFGIKVTNTIIDEIPGIILLLSILASNGVSGARGEFLYINNAEESTVYMVKRIETGTSYIPPLHRRRNCFEVFRDENTGPNIPIFDGKIRLSI